MEIDGKHFENDEIIKIIRQYQRRNLFIQLWKEKNKFNQKKKRKEKQNLEIEKEEEIILCDIEWMD